MDPDLRNLLMLAQHTAAEMGEPVVMLVLDAGALAADGMRAALREGLSFPEETTEVPPLVPLAVALPILQAHGGVPGQVLARFASEGTTVATVWFLCYRPQAWGMAAFAPDGTVPQSRTGFYDDDPLSHQTPNESLASTSPGMGYAHLADGSLVRVHGRNDDLAACAAMVLRGLVDGIGPDNQPLDEAGMVELVLGPWLYLGSRMGHVLAETFFASGRMGERGERARQRLRELLRHPDLASLAPEVEAEITGNPIAETTP